MIHAPKIYADVGHLEIPITVDEDVAGVQFDFLYDPATTYVSVQVPNNANKNFVESSAGHLKALVYSAFVVPNPVCVITLDIAGTTTLVFANARWSDDRGQSQPFDEVDDGEVLVGEDMNVLVEWTDTHPANSTVTKYNIHQDTVLVGTVNKPANEFTVTGVATGSGNIDFAVAAVNPAGIGPLSAPATVNTNLPVAVTNVTATIV